MKRKISFFMAFILMVTTTACNPILPEDTSDGNYATQTPPSAIEYSIYMNKQITVFTSQLTSHIALIINTNGTYENMLTVAEESLTIMNDVLNEVIVTYPAVGYADDRDTTITVMKTCIEHTENYIHDIKDNKDISGYVDKFQNDYYALTGQANLYYQ